MYKEIIKNSVSIAEKSEVVLHQTYGSKELKKLRELQHFKKRKNGYKYKIVKKINKRVKTIVGRLVRKVERKLSPLDVLVYGNDIEIYKKVLAQS